MLSSFDILLIGISFLIMIYGFLRRYRMWKQGGPDKEFKGRRIRRFGCILNYYIFHQKILENRFRGILHLFVFWGFILPLVIVIVGQFKLEMPLWIGQGISLTLDIIGCLALIGVSIFLFTYNKNKEKGKQTFPFHLWILLSILVSGFMAEGTRLNIIETSNTRVMLLSPVGFIVSYIMPASPVVFKLLVRFHFLLILFFIAVIPFSVMRHILAGSLKIYHQDPEAKNTLQAIDLKGNYLGIGSLEEFSWKQLMDGDACVDCSRCEQNCPTAISNQSLSPKRLLEWIKRQMEMQYLNKKPCKGTSKLFPNDEKTLGSQEDIWRCTSCMACVEKCPIMIDQLAKIIDIRRHLVLRESEFPEEYKQVFKNLEVFNEPFGKGSLTREECISNLGLSKLYQEDSKKDIDTIFWIGCISALYDEKSRRGIAAALATLKKAKIPFAVLGKEELCCGDVARRMGNEYLFQKLAYKNIEIFEKYHIKKIITYCPHCFNILRNEYPQLGATFKTIHFLKLLKELINNGNLEIKKKITGRYTYHDPCYLGRYNSIYQEPRHICNFILDQQLIEMERSRTSSFCCGAGGGNFWRGENIGMRMEEIRIDEAREIGADGIITSCPFCEIMLDNATKKDDLTRQLKTIRISELVMSAT